MAKHLDLQEQEQLDQIKHFWARYGNLITWVLIAVFGGFAAWNGWNFWQRSQATQAAALYDEIDRAAAANDAEKIARALGEMKERFPGTTFAAQSALLAGKTLFEAGQTDQARAALNWVIGESSDEDLQAIARLRLAGLDMQAQAYDQALQTLAAPMPKAFEALAADRRGDVLLAQGKPDEARQQYEAAWRGLDERTEYRNLVGVKLASLGVDAASLTPPAEVAR